MTALHDKRCLNHRDREAVARCPRWREFYCRECVKEHQGRVFCAKCLAAFISNAKEGSTAKSITRPLLAAFAFLVIWIFFFAIGRTLLMLPDSFHDGSVWSTTGSIEYIEDEP